MIERVGTNASTIVRDGHMRRTLRPYIADDFQDTLALSCRGYRFCAVDKEIEDNLLQLNRVALHKHRSGRQTVYDRNVPSAEIAACEFQGAQQTPIEIDELQSARLVLEQAAQMTDDLACARIVLDDVGNRLLQLVHVDRRTPNHALGRLGIAHNGHERLLELVGQGTRELAKYVDRK